jgi:hypothetical protein
MAKLPEQKDPTLEAMATEMELAMNEPARGHLGASMIGDACMRKLWYSFRWTATPAFEAATLARFDDGHRSEAIMADRLRLVREIELHTEDADGKQFGFKDCGGHFAGSADGMIRGLLQAPKTPHIWEHKCCNEKKVAQLEKLKLEHGEKQALMHWDAIYYAQAQVYMHYFGMTRHYLTCATPGTRDVTSVRTEYDASYALSLVAKAEQIIASEVPPTRLTERKDDFRCKWCTFKEQCHYDAICAENCRTCRHSRPVDSGWHCLKQNLPIDLETQRLGCGEFQPIDGLITLTEVAA